MWEEMNAGGIRFKDGEVKVGLNHEEMIGEKGMPKELPKSPTT